MYTGLVLNGIISIHHNQQSKHFLCSEPVSSIPIRQTKLLSTFQSLALKVQSINEIAQHG
jgi:hypothetical protein